jgi:hypothetical protein
MTKRRTATGLGDMLRIGALAPVVIGARLTRMAATSPRTRAADAAEWQRMASEKLFALQESWLAGVGAMFALQQQAWSAWWLRGISPWSAASTVHWWQQRTVEAERIGAAVVAPVARRVAQNAKRLQRRG